MVPGPNPNPGGEVRPQPNPGDRQPDKPGDKPGDEHQIRFDWQIFQPKASPQGVNPDDAGDAAARTLGINAKGEAIRRAKKALFARAAMEAEDTPVAADNTTSLPDVLSFRTVEARSMSSVVATVPDHGS